MKIHFVINPRSGRRGRGSRPEAVVRDFIGRRGLDAGLTVTERPAHATEIARRAVAAGCERVVAVGGDGTMNEVAQALVGGPVSLGLVRRGSGNGLARYLGIPASFQAALALAADPAATISMIDTGMVNQRPFFNAMGLGFDAEVTRRFCRNPRRGFLAYAGAVMGEFRARRSERYGVVEGGGRTMVEALFIAIANSDQYGNGAIIAPGARVDDGLLDLVAVPPIGMLQAAGLAARVFLGTLDRSPLIAHRRGGRFVIERPAAGLIHTDGECHEESAALDIRVVPASLRVVVAPK